MPGNKYNRLDTKHIVEGRHDEVLTNRKIYGDEGGGHPTFVRMVILDVISDPSTLDNVKLAYYEHDVGVTNVNYLSVAPRNSIIARKMFSGDAGTVDKVMVLYPFFPSHLSFPAKPGEHVWAMFEHPDATVSELGYWMCKIVQPSFVDDVNYTHADRQFDPSFNPGINDVFHGKVDPKYEFPNGAVVETDGERHIVGSTVSLPGGEGAYVDLLTNSDAAKISTYEPVPRFRKRPADVAIEGSNNTLIVLGTERSGPVADYEVDPNKGKVAKPHADDVHGVGTGTIDFVAGRGQTPATLGNVVTTRVGKEIRKSKSELAPAEGDVDYKNDRSRILIAQKSPIDKRFELSGYNSRANVDKTSQLKESDDGDGGIVLKSDKVRLIARSDVEIIVKGFTRDADGKMVENDDPSTYSSIIMKANGDIVLVPSEKGILKLGGDDASLSPLCTRVNNGGAEGTVKSQPIIDSMGGAQGSEDGLNGTFPRKVLMS